MTETGTGSGAAAAIGRGRSRWARVAALTLLLAVGACAGPQNVLVDLRPYEGQGSKGASPGGSQVTVRIEPVKDARGDAVGSLIGERTTIGSVSMGSIELSPLPTDVMAQLLNIEFARMGYGVGDAAAQFTIGAQLRKFQVVTPATIAYWDINGAIDLDLAAAARDGKTYQASYAATCTDRTYIFPSQDLIRNVVAACVGSIGAKVRQDAGLARFIGGR